MRHFIEITPDKGYSKECFASDNMATYHITSSYGHDLVNDFLDKHERWPTARWYNRNFRFKQIQTEERKIYVERKS